MCTFSIIAAITDIWLNQHPPTSTVLIILLVFSSIPQVFKYITEKYLEAIIVIGSGAGLTNEAGSGHTNPNPYLYLGVTMGEKLLILLPHTLLLTMEPNNLLLIILMTMSSKQYWLVSQELKRYTA